MSNHLDLFLPEWQGYGEDLSVFDGACAVREQLKPVLSFFNAEVPTSEDLEVENGILGYRANLRVLQGVRDVIAREDPATIFLIGGTCASELAPVSFLNKKYRGDVTVLWFDAHGDLNTPQSSSSKHFHGMPLRILLGDGPEEIRAFVFSRLRCSQVILAGSRDLDPSELAYIEAKRILSLPTTALIEGDVLVKAIRKTGSSNLYVHVDLDVLEPKDFPHLLIPTPGGIMFDNLVRLLEQLKDEFPIVGSSILEYVPVGKGDPARIELLVQILRPQVKG